MLCFARLILTLQTNRLLAITMVRSQRDMIHWDLEFSLTTSSKLLENDPLTGWNSKSLTVALIVDTSRDHISSLERFFTARLESCQFFTGIPALVRVSEWILVYERGCKAPDKRSIWFECWRSSSENRKLWALGRGSIIEGSPPTSK